MADYTVKQLKDAARRAYEAGDVAAAEELAQEGIRLQSFKQEKPDRSIMDTLKENIFGEGKVDTVGERVGEAITTAGAGALRGVRGLAELPETVVNLGRMGYQYATGQEVTPLPQQTIAGEKFNQAYGAIEKAAAPVLRGGGLTGTSDIEYRGETGTGQFAGKVGEFLPFAGKRVAQYALAPVVAGIAGEKTAEALGFGETGQAIGEITGMLAGPAAYGGAARGLANVISPYRNADEARLAAAKFLEEKGIPVTAGQKVGSDSLRRKEALSDKFGNFKNDQVEAFTAAAMKEIGSSMPRATPDALIEAQARIGGKMNKALDGVVVKPDLDDLLGLSKAASVYRKSKPIGAEGDEASDLFSRINKAFVSGAKSGDFIDVDQYTSFRSQLSKATMNSNDAIRKAAVKMLDIVDGSLDKELRRLGRNDDFKILNEARKEYRDFFAIEKSISGTGEMKAAGLITPSALGTALRSQSKRAQSQGKRGELGELARAGEQVAVFPRTSNTTADMKQLVGSLARRGGQVASGGAIAAAIGLPYEVGAAIAAIGPSTLEKLMMTKKGQKILANQMFKNAKGSITPEYARAIVAELSQVSDQADGPLRIELTNPMNGN